MWSPKDSNSVVSAVLVGEYNSLNGSLDGDLIFRMNWPSKSRMRSSISIYPTTFTLLTPENVNLIMDGIKEDFEWKDSVYKKFEEIIKNVKNDNKKEEN